MSLVVTGQVAAAGVWKHVGPLHAARIYPATDVVVSWPSGDPTTLTAGTVALTLPTPDVATAAVNLEEGPWLICASQGQTTAYLIKEKDYADLDSQLTALFSDADTTVLARYFLNRSGDYQVVASTGGSGLPASSPGDLLVGDGSGGWDLLHVPS